MGVASTQEGKGAVFVEHCDSSRSERCVARTRESRKTLYTAPSAACASAKSPGFSAEGFLVASVRCGMARGHCM